MALLAALYKGMDRKPQRRTNRLLALFTSFLSL